MDEDFESNDPECYLYVNILGSKIGEKSRRDIVPSTSVKKFKYDDYKKDNNIYKNKLLKIKLHPAGKKEKCNVLYAAIDQEEVQRMSEKKRFGVPKHCETVSEESSIISTMEEESPSHIPIETEENDIELETEETERQKTEMLRKCKARRKRQAETIRKNIEDNQERILDNYLHNLDFNEDVFNVQEPATSTPQSDKTTIRQQEVRIKHLEYQLKECRKEITDINKDYEKRLNQNENRNTVNTSNTACCSSIDHFKVHDKMFGFIKEQAQQELEHDEEGNVHLGSQVYCNPVAFNDAFKSKKPFNCLSLLSEGVYGLEELSKRFVRKQANTRDRKVLSPTKRLQIEKKVYAFMRIKDKTLGEIDDFLDNLNAHHRKVINGAISRLEYLKKVKEKEKEIDGELQKMIEK